MRRCRLVCAALFLAVGALPAAAVDKPAETSRPAKAAEAQTQAPSSTAPNWNGLQLGVSAGFAAAANNFVQRGAYLCGARETYGSNCFETPLGFGDHRASVTAGPFVGWRWQSQSYVSGVEADWSWKRAGSSSAFQLFECYAGPGAFCRFDGKNAAVTQDWDGSFRARYGYLATPSLLLYATGGLAIGQISGAFNFNATVANGSSAGGAAVASASWSDVRAGGTIGAGIETEVWTGWKARLEYRYTDFGTYTKNIPVDILCGSCAAQSRVATINLRESFHTVRIALGFDF